jgi:two-component system, LuxR family, response regulator FixJ
VLLAPLGGLGNWDADMADTIGIVEDDPSLRTTLARQLSALGYRVQLFASAEEFLNDASTSQARLLLVDVDLGDTSGLSLVRQLSSAGFRFPIVFMTGSYDEKIRKKCVELGCVDFLQEPFEEDRLLEAIRAGIESSDDLQT